MPRRARSVFATKRRESNIHSPIRRITAVFVAVLMVAPYQVWAGGYIFAGDPPFNDLILHPQGYTGTETSLTVEVCIDPTSPAPMGGTLTDLEIPLQNNIAIWNQLQPIQGNSLLGAANNIPSGELDFESVALHEIGHCIGLSHVNAASESGLSGNDTNSLVSGYKSHRINWLELGL